MTANATGTPRRGPPPLPSARASTSIQGTTPVTKNTGKLAQLPDPDEVLTTGIHSTYPARSGGSSSSAHRGAVQDKATKTATQAPNQSAVRTPPNDSSRTLSLEMRQEVRDIVSIAIDRALAPQLERVRQLEKELTELRTQRAKLEQLSIASAAPTANLNTAAATRAMAPTAAPAAAAAAANSVGHAAPAPAAANAGFHAAPPTPAAPTPSIARSGSAEATAIPAASSPVALPSGVQIHGTTSHASTDLDDIAWELNGARRRKTVAWLFGVLMFLLLLAAGGAAILSNLNANS